MPRRLRLLLLALLLLLILLVQPTASLLGRKKDKQKKESLSKEAGEAEATTTTTTKDWTRSQQQHQRPGRRRLDKMPPVDGKEDVLGLLLDPVELPLLEDDRVMRGAKKGKSGFFHRRAAADAFVPPESAFRRKEREAGEVGGESGGVGANMSGVSDEHGAFHRLAKRRQQRGQVGIDV